MDNGVIRARDEAELLNRFAEQLQRYHWEVPHVNGRIRPVINLEEERRRDDRLVAWVIQQERVRAPNYMVMNLLEQQHNVFLHANLRCIRREESLEQD